MVCPLGGVEANRVLFAGRWVGVGAVAVRTVVVVVGGVSAVVVRSEGCREGFGCRLVPRARFGRAVVGVVGQTTAFRRRMV